MTHYDFRLAIALSWLDDKAYWPTRYHKPVPVTSTDRRYRRNRSTSSNQRSSRVRRKLINATDVTTISTMTDDHPPDPVACIYTKQSVERVTDDSINNLSHLCRFSMRHTYKSEFTYLPVQALGKSDECQLHRWTLSDIDRNKSRTKKQVMYCSDCKIKLCLIVIKHCTPCMISKRIRTI